VRRDTTRRRRCARANEPRDKGKPLPETLPFPPFLPLITASRARTHDGGSRHTHFQAYLQNELRRSTNRLILMKLLWQRARKSRRDKRTGSYYMHNINAACDLRTCVARSIDVGNAGCARGTWNEGGYLGRTDHIDSSMLSLTVTTSCCPRSNE